MADDVKYAVLEINGEEFQGPVEHHAIAEDIYEDEDKARRTSQLLYSHPHVIGNNKIVEIPTNQQLINIGGFEIKGQLVVLGSLVI